MIAIRRTFLLLLFACCQCAIAVGQANPTARTIIKAMVAQYKHVSSYQDTGTVSVVQSEPKIAHHVMSQRPPFTGTLVSFKTYFARPNMFRFDWKPSKSSRESSIWFDGKSVYQWMPSAGARDETFTLSRNNYIDITVDEAARYSAGAVFPIISMLVAKASVVSFADLLDMSAEFRVVGEESVEGEPCIVIKTNLSGAPWTLWISKQRHLLRKASTVYLYGSFDERVEKGIRHEVVAEETRHDIKINEPLSKDVFHYRPKLLADDSDLTR